MVDDDDFVVLSTCVILLLVVLLLLMDDDRDFNLLVDIIVEQPVHEESGIATMHKRSKPCSACVVIVR